MYKVQNRTVPTVVSGWVLARTDGTLPSSFPPPHTLPTLLSGRYKSASWPFYILVWYLLWHPLFLSSNAYLINQNQTKTALIPNHKKKNGFLHRIWYLSGLNKAPLGRRSLLNFCAFKTNSFLTCRLKSMFSKGPVQLSNAGVAPGVFWTDYNIASKYAWYYT